MGFFKRTNKKFEYKPRYYKGEGNPYQIEHKFDQFRTTVGKNKSLKAKLVTAYDEIKTIRSLNRTVVLIAAILFLIFAYIIDFDFSIFLPKD